MADQQQIGAAYNYLDELFQMVIGKHGDFTGAMYNGDFSMTLEEAQDAKHKFILDSVGAEEGKRILDIGSGWGPLLNKIRERKATPVGVTLSTAQYEHCKKNGFEVYVQDWKTMDKETYGTFDGIASVGAFEHFCSKEEFLEGKQEQIYGDFFKKCAEMLPDQGRLFVQTQLYGKAYQEKFTHASVNAPKDSDEFIVALVEKFYPGSWLPMSEEQIIEAAKPYFKVVSLNNGRLDYLQTIGEWRKRLYKWNFRKYLKIAGLVKYFFTDKDFRFRMRMVNQAAHRKCLEREIFTHQRMVFEKV